MELHQLETFLAVAEERSFSRAAVRLHRTQPAVSQVIRKLEASVGETLFDRAARDGSLTAAGVLLRDYALRLLALRREATSALGELKSLERGLCNWRPTSTPACTCCRPSTATGASFPTSASPCTACWPRAFPTS
jgi:DNA-binding transcriptional LysR family regulator